MTRIRTKSQGNDGGAFHPHNRPPVHLLTDKFRALFSEYDAMVAQASHAKSELHDLNNNWPEHAAKARRADSAATADASRNGAASIVTTAANELHDRKRQLEERVTASEAAARLIWQDLPNEREAEKAHLDRYIKAEEKARAHLVKLLAQVSEAAEELSSTIGLREWVGEHLPYENTVQFDIGLNAPVQLRVVTAALANL